MEKIQIQNLNWIDLVDPDRKDIEYLRENFNFHPVVLKELLSPTLRPKVEHYNGYLFMVLHFPIYHPKEKSTKSLELDFLITKDALITIRYEKIQPLQEFWKKCQTDRQYLYFQNSPALLLHCMLEELSNFSLRQIDHITKKINDIEKRMFKTKKTKEETELVEKILLIRKDILDFRRTIKPQAMILKSLKARGIEFFGKKIGPYFTDIIGDYMRVWDLLENHKETIESLQQTNDSRLSYRLGDIMKVLTVMSFITFPLGVIVGFFGMNVFDSIPIVRTYPYTWLFILAFMLLITTIMILYFKKRKWL